LKYSSKNSSYRICRRRYFTLNSLVKRRNSFIELLGVREENLHRNIAGFWVGVGEEVRVALGLGVLVGVLDAVAIRVGVDVWVGHFGRSQSNSLAFAKA